MAAIEWTSEELDKLVDTVQTKYGVSLLGHQDRLRNLVRDWATSLAEADVKAQPRPDAGSPTQEDIDKQWPGFTVTCKACGCTRITVEDSRGWSELSGAWGSVDWKCLGCGFSQEIIENG